MTAVQPRDIFNTPLRDLTAVERAAYAHTMSWEIIARMHEAVSRRYGPEGRKLADDCIRDYMRDITPKISKSLGIEGKDLKSALEVMNWHDVNLWPMMEEDAPIVNGNEGVFRVRKCFLKDRWTPHDCKIGIPYVEGMLEAFSPKFKYKATKVLSRGDDCCELVMRVEE